MSIKYSIILTIFALALVKCQKPGSCPQPPDFGICIMGCSHDFSCQGNLKCCSNGCGYTCQVPITKQADEPISKECPVDNTFLVGLCAITEKSCWSDSMCKSNQRCCRKGCNRECIDV
ncbi:unnamed protein product [Brachionus calyciflorus]|uniref:WAP domain-containing protein n=1 Tax=Brachionus calyciflorus TaxID=104777 RepID=A0A813UXR0_9BILA|nr:unnamed protein product [Brachionus calyciflorus]